MPLRATPGPVGGAALALLEPIDAPHGACRRNPGAVLLCGIRRRLLEVPVNKICTHHAFPRVVRSSRRSAMEHCVRHKTQVSLEV
jgi:hypothetical protein